MIVTQVHHLLLDSRGLIIKENRDNTHQISIFKFLIIELTEERSTSFTNDFASPSVAMIIRKIIDSLKQLFWH